MLNFENCEKSIFAGVPPYGIPEIAPAVGCRAALERLTPREVLWYGRCPQEFDWNVVRIKPHYDDIVRRRKNGGAR